MSTTSSSSRWEVWAIGKAWIHGWKHSRAQKLVFLRVKWPSMVAAGGSLIPRVCASSFQCIHCHSFVAFRSCQFFHVKSVMSSHSFQFTHFKSCISLMSSHSFQFVHVNSFVSVHACQFLYVKSSFQLIHVSSFISCISCHVNSLLLSSPWIPISHVSSWKLPSRRVPGTTWYTAHHCAMSPLYLHMLASKVSCRMLGGKNSFMMCMRRLCHWSHTAEAFTKTWHLRIWYCSFGSLTKLYTHCVRLHTMSHIIAYHSIS